MDKTRVGLKRSGRALLNRPVHRNCRLIHLIHLNVDFHQMR